MTLTVVMMTITMRTTNLQVLHEDDALLLRFGHEDTAATEETVLEQKAVNLLILHSK